MQALIIELGAPALLFRSSVFLERKIKIGKFFRLIWTSLLFLKIVLCVCTVYPRSFEPFYIVTYYANGSSWINVSPRSLNTFLYVSYYIDIRVVDPDPVGFVFFFECRIRVNSTRIRNPEKKKNDNMPVLYFCIKRIQSSLAPPRIDDQMLQDSYFQQKNVPLYI